MNTDPTHPTPNAPETLPMSSTQPRRSLFAAIKDAPQPSRPAADDPLTRFDIVEAADELTPLPRDTYEGVATAGKLIQSSRGTDGYRLEFRVTQGEYNGRRLWHTYWLSEKALPFSKRDLKKFGIDSLLTLKSPFPADRYVCRLAVVVKCEDDGRERNEVTCITVLRTQEPPANPFPLPPAAEPEAQK
jgi:hypothetical protein